MATMVSSVENMQSAARLRRFDGPTAGGVTRPKQPTYLTEMMTVFSKASPILSDETDSTSATARCTMRRS